MLGNNFSVFRGACVGAGVRLGDSCKLQNYSMVYEPAVLEDGVSVGPGVVLTNDQYPRSASPEGRLKDAASPSDSAAPCSARSASTRRCAATVWGDSWCRRGRTTSPAGGGRPSC